MSPNASLDLDRKAHPLALQLWTLLKNRSEADRRLVYDALRLRIGVPELPAKQEQAGEALRRFITAQETARQEQPPPSWSTGPPSRRNYDTFRSSQSDPKAWPSSQFICDAFGRQWNAALAAIGQRPAVDVLSRRLVATGRPYSRSEVLAALRLWVEEVNRTKGLGEPLRQGDYKDWADAQRRSAQPLLPRFPTIPTIRDYIGRWHEVLVALNCAQRRNRAGTGLGPADSGEPAAAFDFESVPPPVPRSRWHHQPGSSESSQRADALLMWLRWVATQLPESSRSTFRARDYDRLVASIRRVSLLGGEPLDPPSSRQISRSPEIGSWDRAKQLAGLIAADIPVLHRTTRPFSEEELLQPLLAAVGELGTGISRPAYNRWRKDNQTGDGSEIRSSSEARRIPSEALIRQRFNDGGNWHVAVVRALNRAEQLGMTSLPHEKQMRRAA